MNFQILKGEFKTSKIGDFVDMFKNRLSRSQVRYVVSKFVDEKFLSTKGEGYRTTYSLGQKTFDQHKVIGRALELGFRKWKKEVRLKKIFSQDPSNCFTENCKISQINAFY